MGLTESTVSLLASWGAGAILPAVVTAVIAYLCGCFNGAVIVSKYILRDDVRNHGSGNAGLTNFYRTFGGPLTFVVILTDVLKAVVAVLVGVFLVGQLLPIDSGAAQTTATALAKYWTGLFCLLGHMFPCMFQFKGGKGILSGGTIAIMIDWRVALVVWGCFLVLAVLTRYVSLGSIAATASMPVSVFLLMGHNWLYTALSAAVAALVIWCHRGNIQRLLSGTEKKFHWHVDAPAGGEDGPQA